MDIGDRTVLPAGGRVARSERGFIKNMEVSMTDEELKKQMENLGIMMHKKEMKEQTFLAENKQLFDDIEERKEQIRKEILARKTNADSPTLKITYRKGAIRWKTDWLEGYSIDHPDILKYRKQGEPSVSFSLKSDGMFDE